MHNNELYYNIKHGYLYCTYKISGLKYLKYIVKVLFLIHTIVLSIINYIGKRNKILTSLIFTCSFKLLISFRISIKVIKHSVLFASNIQSMTLLNSKQFEINSGTTKENIHIIKIIYKYIMEH